MTVSMHDRPPVSVCVATYNGSPWVGEQLKSILVQLAPSDEVIVVDDLSTDDTVAVLGSLNDVRVRLIQRSSNGGHVRAFEDALSSANNPIVFLADQDDVWEASRVKWMMDRLEARQMVATNMTLFGRVSGKPDLELTEHPGPAWFTMVTNVLGLFAGRRPYFGCAMAFRREILEVALPFPASVEAHDQWLALVGNCAGQMCHDERSSVRRRIHGANLTSSRRGWRSIVVTRLKLIVQLWVALGRLARRRFI